VWWPALIGPRTREIFTLGGQRESEENFTQWSVGGELATLYRRSFRTTYRLGLNLSWVNVDERNPDFAGAKDGWMTYLDGVWNWDTSNDRLFPRSGAVTWVNFEYSPPVLSVNEYFRTEIGGSFYFPLFRKAVFATRGVVGQARPVGSSTEIIPGKRFYAGGVNTHRGFNRRRLGPKGTDAEPIGGRVMLLTMTEVRIPVVWMFWGAVFFDLGQVWRVADDVKLSQLEPAAGPALMVQSPVGPIRVDYGFRLNGGDSEPASVFHFMIGNPF
jgi:outer membrane protein insertion porin family